MKNIIISTLRRILVFSTKIGKSILFIQRHFITINVSVSVLTYNSAVILVYVINYTYIAYILRQFLHVYVKFIAEFLSLHFSEY
jgi:hypothetical protein